MLGLGYIGLPTAAMLANAGHSVVGVDVNAGVLTAIETGCAHVAEPQVQELVRAAFALGTLSLTPKLPESADAYIICVPTPTSERKADLHYVEEAAREVASRVRDGDLIVLESTVPPGTVENLIVPALRAAGRSPDRVHIAHCPERVIPGSIAEELRHNARVIGGRRPADAQAARTLYASFCDGELCITDCATAELVKVVENTFRDVNLAFANELAILSEALGADVWEVIRLANKHPRVNVLRPGPGVGGHCIPVDPKFLANANPFVTELIQTARRVNERMPHVVARAIDEMLLGSAGARITLLGAAYKADVDDTRESPALALYDLLKERRHSLTVYDPHARTFEHPLAATLEDAVRESDAIVVVTDHRVFREIDPHAIAALVRRKLLFDTRNLLDAQAWAQAGFTVRMLGVRPAPVPAQVAQTA